MAENVILDSLSEVDFADFFFDLEQFGWFHYVFPFLLVYAIVLTILNQVEIFKKNKSVRVIIALVFALFSVAFPISDGYCEYSQTGGACTIGDLMISLFPGVTAFSLGVLALYIVAAMLGVDLTEFISKDKPNVVHYVLGGIGTIFVIYYFGRGFGWFDGYGSASDFWLVRLLYDPLFYILIVFGLIFWWVSKEDNHDSDVIKKEVTETRNA